MHDRTTLRRNLDRIMAQAYSRSSNHNALSTQFLNLDSTTINEVDNFRTIVEKQSRLVLVKEFRENCLKEMSLKQELNRELYSNIAFPDAIKSKTPLSKHRKNIENEMTDSINLVLLRLDKKIKENPNQEIQVPSLIGLIESYYNLSKLENFYKHEYLLQVLGNIKKNATKSNYTLHQHRGLDILIENAKFIGQGAQKDHLFVTALRGALFSHLFQSSHDRHNVNLDSNWCIFVPVRKDTKHPILKNLLSLRTLKQQDVKKNLNTVRTAGAASSTLEGYNLNTTLEEDLAEMRDNGILGDQFRIGLRFTELTVSQQHEFLITFVNSFEFGIHCARRSMSIKYGITKNCLVPSCYFLTIYDLNVRFQRCHLALKKIRNGDTTNIIKASDLRAVFLAIVEHKNTVIQFIQEIYKTSSSENSDQKAQENA